MKRFMLVTLVLVGCSHEPTYSPVIPYDAESARIINDLGIQRRGGVGLVAYVYRYDLKVEEIDGKIKARLTKEKENPLVFKAGMSPNQIIKAAQRDEMDRSDPLVKRAKEIWSELKGIDADSEQGKALKVKLTEEFDRTLGLREAVIRVANDSN